VTPSTAGSLTYTLACTGAGGSANASATLTVTSPPAPTAQISSSSSAVFVGQPLTLSWSSTNASSCAASGAWSGTQQLSGNQSVTPSSAGNLAYTITCTGPGGSANASATVTATTPSVSVSNTFSPNATTISTSEGAPYGDCDFWVETLSTCYISSNFGYGPTKVMRLYICLSGEVSTSVCSNQPAVTGPLPQTMLNDMGTRLAAFAGSGMRLMLRFTYNFGPVGPGAMDAPIDVISTNIGEVAPIVLQYKDLIFAVEAGFIGTWGEWHDSTNGNETAAAQATVLNEELSDFSGLFPILVRMPGQLIQYTGTAVPNPGLGMHDDYYASSGDDGATWDNCIDTAGTIGDAGFCVPNYTPSQLQSYAAAVSTTTMFAGEFGALYPSLQTCSALSGYSFTYHVQSISLNPYPADIGTELQNEGCALSFYNMVGTRIELQGATIIGNPTPNGQLYVSVTLVNTGYGRVIRPRPVTLVFLSGASVVAQIPIALTAMDLRQLASASTPTPATFQVNVTLPATFPSSGSISAALLIPDPAPSLTAQPAYALPLNSLDQQNTSVFDANTGYNVIGTFNAN